MKTGCVKPRSVPIIATNFDMEDLDTMSFTRLCPQCSVSRKTNAFVVTCFVSGSPLLLRRAKG